VLVTVLGEIPDREAALRELRRVLKPEGRLVIGELALDPHVVFPGALERAAAAAGLRVARRDGSALGYFAELRRG
jgi:ubiquinone/menaquinone biosynthesis C-methylase UbiE